MRSRVYQTALLLLLTACSPPNTTPRWPDDNSLTMALGNAPTNLDPRVGTDQASGRVFQLIHNGLVTKDSQGNLIPDLAESWEVLDEGRRYRFHLRSGITFHDGSPFTAEDVVWTYKSILDDIVITAKKAAFNVVERIEAVDPLTVDLILYEPYGPLLADLTPAQGIIPAGITTEQMNEHPIGTGPFQFHSRTPETVILEANPLYRDGRPKLDRVIFKEVPDSTVRALELMNGSVQLVINDLAPDVVPLFRKNPHFQVVESPGAIYAYLGINMEDPILSDVRVRRALALSIDRQRLVDTLWQGLGVVTETILPPGLWARNDDLAILPHDPQEAQRLLEEAGYPDPDGDGPLPRLTLTYKTSTNEPYVLQAQVIQAMAKEAGIEIILRTYEFATFYADVKKGNFQIFALQRTGVVDPNIYRLTLHSASIPPAGQNRGRYSDPEFDQLIDQGAALTLPEERRPFYLRAQEIVAEELPYISLYTKENYAVLPAGMTGYENYPSGEVFSLWGVGWGGK